MKKCKNCESKNYEIETIKVAIGTFRNSKKIEQDRFWVAQKIFRCTDCWKEFDF